MLIAFAPFVFIIFQKGRAGTPDATSPAYPRWRSPPVNEKRHSPAASEVCRFHLLLKRTHRCFHPSSHRSAAQWANRVPSTADCEWRSRGRPAIRLARMAGGEQQHRVSHTVKHLLHRLPFFYGKGMGLVIPQGTLLGVAFGKSAKGRPSNTPPLISIRLFST